MPNHDELAGAIVSALSNMHACTHRERIAAQVLTGLVTATDQDGIWRHDASIAAETAVEYADALLVALHPNARPAARPAGLVCMSATYKHAETGREVYATRNDVGRYTWVARDGTKTIDVGSASTEEEAIAQAIAAVERPA